VEREAAEGPEIEHAFGNPGEEWNPGVSPGPR
jgi:hypothetical protein